MGSREDTIRAIYACFNDDRIEELDALIPPSAVLVQDPAFPDARTWRGAEGVMAWYSQITGQFSSVDIELIELEAAGDVAIAIVEIAVQGRTSGAAVRHQMAHLWTFRDDAPERCRFYLDVEAGRADFDRLRTAVAET